MKNGHTADQLVERYLALRAKVEAISEEFDKQLAPYKAAMTAIEGAAADMLRETGQTALKTEHGTAYTSETMSVRCADRSAFLTFVFEHHAEQFLTAHVAKEAVKEFMDANGGHLPPGVDVTKIQRVNFRKA